MRDEHTRGSSLAHRASRLSHGEPLDNVEQLLTELAERRMPLRRSYFVSYFIRFAPDDRRQADDAEPRARVDGWETAQYSDAGGQVLRLSRQGAVSPGRLQTDRRSIRTLSADGGGRWEGIVIEELQQRAHWSEIADRVLLQAIPRQAAASPAATGKTRLVTSRSAAAVAR